MAGMGFEVASEVVAGALLGWGFDAWQGTSPKGLLIGSIIGIAVGLWNLIRRTLKLNRLLDKKHPTRSRGRLIPSENDKDDDWNRDD